MRKSREVNGFTILEALISLMPENEEKLTANFLELKTQFSELNSNMNQISASLNDVQIYASHPVYQYLAKAYGLKINSEHWEPDVFPGEEQWSQFNHKLDHNPSDLMIWEDHPIEETKIRLDELGVKVIVFNPGGNRPDSGDFISLMHSNMEALNNYISKIPN